MAEVPIFIILKIFSLLQFDSFDIPDLCYNALSYGYALSEAFLREMREMP